MTEHVAGPGQMTCINDDCRVSGLAIAEPGTTCPVCRGQLARVPDDRPAEADEPVRADGPVPGNGRMPAPVWRDNPLVKVAIAVIVTVAASSVLYLVRNPDLIHRLTGPEFTVGDCVRVVPDLHGSRMVGTECRPNKLMPGAFEEIYQVDAVRDGKDGYCPPGLARVTFSNEPEDTTYCLHLTSFGS